MDEDSVVLTEQNGVIQVAYIAQNCEEIPQFLGEKYGTAARRLDLSFNLLRSLGNISTFIKLEELILDNNELDDTVEFPYMPQLHTLTLNKNKMTDIEALVSKVVSKLPGLTYLSLLGNQACPNELSSSDKDEEDYQRYRYYVLYRLPTLKFLDFKPITDAERSEAKRVGEYTRVIKPQETSGDGNVEGASQPAYTPLSNTVKEGGQHKGTFGQCRYVYYGRHSEGNRFIRNNDL